MNSANYLHNASKMPKGTKILFAAFPGDGHFNPLTGLAVHLKAQGYDVRFYTASAYREKVERLGIPYFPFVRARELDVDKIDETFPDRKHQKSQIAKLNYDVINVFIKQGPEYYNDLKNIRKAFPFDLLIADTMPYADICNQRRHGQYALSIEYNLPLVYAGVYEGKNEICARVGYFNLGINLKTERPLPAQLRKAVEDVTGSELYRIDVAGLSREFSRYKTNELCKGYVRQLLGITPFVQRQPVVEEAVY